MAAPSYSGPSPIRGGVGKVACWSTKAAISLKRVKIEEKLLWRAYRKSQTLFHMLPTPYGLSFPKIGGLQPNPKTAIAISGTAKATGCKFGRYIHWVHPNTNHEKFWRKGCVGVSRDCPNFWITPIISGTGKPTNFQFCTQFIPI